MKRIWIALPVMAAIALALGLTFRAENAAANGPPSAVIADQYIVVLQDDASPAQVAARHGLQPRFAYGAALNGFAGVIPPGIVRALEVDPDVLSVQPDRAVRITAPPPGKGKPGGGAGNSQLVPPNITRIGAAPGALNYTGAGIGIAFVDTGLDVDNPDLRVAARCFDAFATPTDTTPTSGGPCDDGHGHSTHVAGIAAARDNNAAVVGVAPGATVVSVRVLDSSGGGSWATVIGGLDWIAANYNDPALNIRVVNASLGGLAYLADTTATDENGNPTDALRIAVKNVTDLGIVFIAASGNTPEVDLDGQYEYCDPYTLECGDTIVPAAYPEAIAIASSTAVDGAEGCAFGPVSISADSASWFSTDGEKVLVSAPGEEREDVDMACFIGGTGVLSLALDGGTTRMGGTSMAAPHAAGVAALLLSKNSTLTVAEVTAALGTADLIGTAPYNSPAVGWTYDGEREGILSASAALAAVSAGEPPAVPPTASFDYSCTDLDCTFTDTSSDDGAIMSRSWDFGEAAATSTDPNPAHTYAAGGDYTVILTVTDNDGSTDTTEQVITVSSGGNGGGPDCTKKPNHPKCQ